MKKKKEDTNEEEEIVEEPEEELLPIAPLLEPFGSGDSEILRGKINEIIARQ